jgi:hypothetical protein
MTDANGDAWGSWQMAMIFDMLIGYDTILQNSLLALFKGRGKAQLQLPSTKPVMAAVLATTNIDGLAAGYLYNLNTYELYNLRYAAQVMSIASDAHGTCVVRVLCCQLKYTLTRQC